MIFTCEICMFHTFSQVTDFHHKNENVLIFTFIISLNTICCVCGNNNDLSVFMTCCSTYFNINSELGQQSVRQNLVLEIGSCFSLEASPRFLSSQLVVVLLLSWGGRLCWHAENRNMPDSCCNSIPALQLFSQWMPPSLRFPSSLDLSLGTFGQRGGEQTGENSHHCSGKLTNEWQEGEEGVQRWGWGRRRRWGHTLFPLQYFFFFFLGSLVGRLFACGGPWCCFVSSPALRSVRMLPSPGTQTHKHTNTNTQPSSMTTPKEAEMDVAGRQQAAGCFLTSSHRCNRSQKYVFILENCQMNCHKPTQSTTSCYLLPNVLTWFYNCHGDI